MPMWPLCFAHVRYRTRWWCADSVRARCFEANSKHAAWAEIACLVNPDGRALGCDATTDHLPRTHESSGPSRHAIEPHTTLPAKSIDAFVRTVSETLEHDHRARRFDRLVLVASPHLLGVPHAHFSKSLRTCVAGELRLHIAGLPADEIRARVPREFAR